MVSVMCLGHEGPLSTAGPELIDSDGLQVRWLGLLTLSGVDKSWNSAQIFFSQFVLKARV